MLKKLKNNESEIIDILEMAQIIYTDGKKEFFEVIHIAKEGVYTGRMRNHNEFIDCGFIPTQIIKEIMGGTERRTRKKKSKYQ